jgi:hypothetical protein
VASNDVLIRAIETLAIRITAVVGWIFTEQFVPPWFGQWVEEPGWTATDDARGNIVEWIRIKFGGLSLLTIDRP